MSQSSSGRRSAIVVETNSKRSSCSSAKLRRRQLNGEPNASRISWKPSMIAWESQCQRIPPEKICRSSACIVGDSGRYRLASSIDT